MPVKLRTTLILPRYRQLVVAGNYPRNAGNRPCFSAVILHFRFDHIRTALRKYTSTEIFSVNCGVKMIDRKPTNQFDNRTLYFGCDAIVKLFLSVEGYQYVSSMRLTNIELQLFRILHFKYCRRGRLWLKISLQIWRTLMSKIKKKNWATCLPDLSLIRTPV